MVTLNDVLIAYRKAIKHNPKSKEVIKFSKNLEINLLSIVREINSRTLKLDSNFAFVVSKPKYREVFGTKLKNRILHHLLDIKLRPIYESVLSDRTFNNRKGKGLTHAIQTFENDIKYWLNVSKNVWLIHLDLKGYFPNANVEIALKQQLDLINRYYNGIDKEDLLYVMMKCMKADPAHNCKVYGSSNWKNIPKEKSLFSKPIGVGAAIGFLCWQNAMGLYINHIVKWLQSFSFLKLIVFVDDIYISTINKDETLKLIPNLRNLFSYVKVSINENKFYCQHFSKGIMCLGSVLKYGRKYIKNSTYYNILKRIKELRYNKAEKQLASMNSYSGMFKGKQQFRRLIKTIKRVCKYLCLVWNTNKKCFKIRNKYGYCY